MAGKPGDNRKSEFYEHHTISQDISQQSDHGRILLQALRSEGPIDEAEEQRLEDWEADRVRELKAQHLRAQEAIFRAQQEVARERERDTERILEVLDAEAKEQRSRDRKAYEAELDLFKSQRARSVKDTRQIVRVPRQPAFLPGFLSPAAPQLPRLPSPIQHRVSIAGSPQSNRLISMESYGRSDLMVPRQDVNGVTTMTAPPVRPIEPGNEGKNGEAEASVHEQMMAEIIELKTENELLNQRLLKHDLVIPAWLVFHRVRQSHQEMFYLDEPHWAVENRRDVFKGQTHIRDPLIYASCRSNIAFMVTKIYSLQPIAGGPQKHCEAVYTSEKIQFISAEMKTAFSAFVENQPNFYRDFPDYDERNEIESPYLIWYRYRSNSISGLQQKDRDLIMLLKSYIEQSYGYEHRSVDEMFDRGMVSRRACKYLIRPGDVLIDQNHTCSPPQASVASSWTRLEPNNTELEGESVSDSVSDSAAPEPIDEDSTWTVKSWFWDYQEKFVKKNCPALPQDWGKR